MDHYHYPSSPHMDPYHYPSSPHMDPYHYLSSPHMDHRKARAMMLSLSEKTRFEWEGRKVRRIREMSREVARGSRQ